MSFSTRQRLSRESGRDSTMITRSPVLYSFFSSCALNLVRLVKYLPYLPCETRRSTNTTRVLVILSLVMTPTSLRLRESSRSSEDAASEVAGAFAATGALAAGLADLLDSVATAYFSYA